MIDTPQLARSLPLFAALPPAEVEALVATLRQVSYPKQTVLFREGDVGDRFYIILEGRIAIVKSLGTDDERLVGVRVKGEYIGEMSLINEDGLRTASAFTYEDLLALELTRDEFYALLTRYPALTHTLLRVLSRRLSESNEAAIHDLHEKNERLARAYAELQAAQALLIEQETLAHELQLARDIQQSMLPGVLPQLNDLELGALMLAAHMVGGDFYDVFALGPDHLGLAVGDVAGKGMPAALYMALACSLLRAEATRAGAEELCQPERVLRLLNRHLLSRNIKGMFVTLLYGVLCRSRREFSYVRAGHPFPLLWDASGRPVPLVEGRAHPLGMFPNPILDVQSILLPPGSTLLLYTDGVTEAMDPQRELFGVEPLSAIIAAQPAAPAQSLCNQIMQALRKYQGVAPQADDITLLTVRA